MLIVTDNNNLHNQSINRKSNDVAKYYIFEAEKEVSNERKLLLYNLGLMYAENKAIILDIYEKRCKMYANLKLYHHIVQNQAWMKEINPNISVQYYNYGCLEEKSKKHEVKFKGKTHSRQSEVLKSIRISDDEKVITNKRLKAGTLIAIETSFCGVLFEHGAYRHCRMCLKSNNLNLIACDNCTSAMFCSTDCKIAAEFHHKYECITVMDYKLPMHLGGIHTALRTCFEILNECDDSVENMKKFVINSIQKSRNLLKQKKTPSKSIQLNAAMLSLKRFKIDEQELLSTIKKVVNIFPRLHEIFKTKDDKKFLIEFLSIQSTLDSVVHSDVQTATAISIHFLYSLMDHSCSSNVYGILKDEKLYYFTKYPIPKGGMLTYNHNVSFDEFSLEERSMIFKNLYGYNCECCACSMHYPTIEKLNFIDQSLKKNIENAIQSISTMKRKRIKKLFASNCKYINQHFNGGCPSLEVLLMHKCNLIAMSYMISS